MKRRYAQYTLRVYSLRVDDQSVPLPFDVVLGRLLCDVKAIKLQPPGHLFLTFEDHKWHLKPPQNPPITHTHTPTKTKKHIYNIELLHSSMHKAREC